MTAECDEEFMMVMMMKMKMRRRRRRRRRKKSSSLQVTNFKYVHDGSSLW
jgi:hypothetical protein